MMDFFVSNDIMQERPQNPEDGTASDTDSTTGSQKKNLLPWKIVCLVLVLLVSLGWVGIIVLLIMKEEWQLVLVAWLLLYAAVHFCYWYCRRHSSRAFSSQIRNEVVARIRGTEAAPGGEGDAPPSYDDLVKYEVPPPAYYTVVKDSPKSKHRMLSLHSLPLPWFIKKKALQQSGNDEEASFSNKATTSTTVAVVDIEGGAVASTSTAQSASNGGLTSGESGQTWKSPGSDTAIVHQSAATGTTAIMIEGGEDEAPELPSYESLMREAAGSSSAQAQPVMTPIHQALANLPRVPSPGAQRTLRIIAEAEQENQQQQQQQQSQ